MARLCCFVVAALLIGLVQFVARGEQNPSRVEYRILATSKTATMEKELNEDADAGFRYQAVMGGDTAIGGKEVVTVLSRIEGAQARYQYKLLATSKTSTRR